MTNHVDTNGLQPNEQTDRQIYKEPFSQFSRKYLKRLTLLQSLELSQTKQQN